MTVSDRQIRAHPGGEPARAVAVVGLGALGLPMARRLRLSGFDVTGVEPVAAPRARAAAIGIPCVADITDVANRAVTVVVVATGSQLLDVARSAIGHGEELTAETWIIASTVGPRDARRVADLLHEHGAVVLDASVTGGVSGAVNGKLRFFTAGPADVVEQQRTLLRSLGQVLHVGASVGDGQAMTLVNQLCSSTHLVVAAEAVSFAVALGRDPGRAVAAISGGCGASWFPDGRGPRMATDIAWVGTRLAVAQYVQAARRRLREEDDSRIFFTYFNHEAGAPAAGNCPGVCP